MTQKQKSGTELKTSIYLNLVLKSLSGLVAHKILRLGVKIIGWRTKLEDKCLHLYPTSHILTLTQAIGPDSIHFSYLSRWLSWNSFNRKVCPSQYCLRAFVD